MFFKAPPISTPFISFDLYILILAPFNSCLITSSNVSNVESSSPFEQITIGLFPTNFLYLLNVLLVNFEGVTCKINSLSFITSSMSFEQTTFSLIFEPGIKMHLCSLLIAFFSSSVNDHKLTLFPHSAK